MNQNQNQLPELPEELWCKIYDFKEAMETKENIRKLKPISDSIKELNKMVLDPDTLSMGWGWDWGTTEEEADDNFNREFDDDGELNEWGTKSAGILYYIDMVGEEFGL